jgi:hypothetical protein
LSNGTARRPHRRPTTTRVPRQARRVEGGLAESNRREDEKLMKDREADLRRRESAADDKTT